jgi:hypothetical protein
MMRAASDAEPVSRILYGVAAADGHSSRPVIADRLKRPTRKFDASSRDVWRFFKGSATACACFALAPGSSRTALTVRSPVARYSFPIWSCSVWGLPCPVHCCAGGALLPHLFTLTATVEHLRPCGLAPALPLRPAQKRIGFRHSLQSKGSATACACFTLASGSSRTALTVRSPGRRRYIFCGTFRKVALKPPSRTLSGTLLCGVRTFLSLDRAARESPASTSQTATIRFDISYPYYKMNSGSKGFLVPHRQRP